MACPYFPVNNEMDFLLNVNDLKQFVYCPRIVYYTWVMPVRPRPQPFSWSAGISWKRSLSGLNPGAS